MDIIDIKEKAIIGSKWLIIEKFSLQIVQFIVGIILARLLGPETFGLVALTYVFLAISGIIMDGGFEKALIQNQHLSTIQINTAFYINISLGVLMALIICILAPTISRFFNMPELTNVLRVLSIGLPVDAFGQTQRMLIMKELNFKKVSIGQIFRTLVSGVVGITLAFYGFGVWALVYSSLASTITWVLIFWYKSSWYPKLEFSYTSVSKLVPFGLNVLANGVLFSFLQQFNNFIVGKYYSKAELGLFNRGMKFPEMISAIVEGVILKMSFPLFSKLQYSEMHLKSLMRKSNRVVAFISFPLLAFMFINAKEIILFLLTDKWIGAVIFLKMFCLVSLFNPFINLQREMLLAKGKAKLSFRLFIITSIIETIPILLLVRYEIIYIVWVVLISKIFQYVLYNLVTSGKLNIPIKESFKWIAPYFLIVFFVVGGVQLLNYFLQIATTSLFLKLVIDFFVGGGLYFFIIVRLKMEELTILKLTLLSVFKRRNKI